jgi:hypothetical protein
MGGPGDQRTAGGGVLQPQGLTSPRRALESCHPAEFLPPKRRRAWPSHWRGLFYGASACAINGLARATEKPAFASANGEPSSSLTNEQNEAKQERYANDALEVAECLAKGCQVSGGHKCWGFWIELNHEAAELYGIVLKQIEEHLPQCFGPEINRGIAFALQLKENQIKKADERSGGKGR